MNLSNCKVHFVTQERLAANTRRRYEFQMSSTIGSLVKRFASRETLDVIVTDQSSSVLCFLAGQLEWSSATPCDEQQMRRIGQEALNRPSGNKHKQSLAALIEELIKLKCDQQANVVVLYSYIDDMYRVLV